MKEKFTQKTYTYTTGLEVLKKYCVYQERSHTEVYQKALSLQFTCQEIERAICQLIEENFLNEERFAKRYTEGKFRTQKWGPQKIKYMLRQKGVSDILIRESLSQISEQEQSQSLQILIQKKRLTIKDKNPLLIKQKIVRYLMSKGFERDKILDLVEQEIKP